MPLNKKTTYVVFKSNGIFDIIMFVLNERVYYTFVAYG